MLDAAGTAVDVTGYSQVLLTVRGTYVVVTITFEAVGDKTRLTIHAALQTAADREAAIAGGFSMGWNDSLDRLAELLARR